ncbi:urease accessory protein UreD [Jatrophihabitans sp. DSM 45814]
MKSRSVAMVDPGGVLRTVSCSPPLTVRQVRVDDPTVCGICLVGSAAGPLAGDDVEFELTVANHGRANVVAAGASIAQGRSGGSPARLRTQVSVGDFAELDATPAPVIVSDGSFVRIELDFQLAATAKVRWRELLVLGRSGERSGAALLSWKVDRGGAPLLRQRIDLSERWRFEWPGMLSGQRVLATALVTGPDVEAQTVILDSTAVAQQVDEHTALLTVLASSATDAEFRLDQLLKYWQ